MQTKVLSLQKKLIENILNAKPADRLGIFDLDIELFDKDRAKKESDKFFLFAFEGPFQNISSKYGLQESLTKFIQNPRNTASSYNNRLKQVIKEYKGLKEDGFCFDGVWMWEDIAYNNGLYFSTEKYRSQLFDVHKDICGFFKSQGVPLFFHCDGKVNELMSFLADAGVMAVHPIQESCNGDILKLKNIFQGVITFVGGVGISRLKEDRKELFDYIRRLNEGGNYIFSLDGPLPKDFDNKEYNKILTDLRSEL